MRKHALRLGDGGIEDSDIVLGILCAGGKQKLQIEELSRALIFTFHILGTYFYNFLEGYDGKFYVIFIFSQ